MIVTLRDEYCDERIGLAICQLISLGKIELIVVVKRGWIGVVSVISLQR